MSPAAKGRLAGKRALITGGAGGIGSKVAEMMAREGAEVALSDLDGDAVQTTATAIADRTGQTVVGLQHDVTDKAAWEQTVDAAAQALGGLNVLINNAGICIPGSVEDIDMDDWDRTMDVDLRSVFLGCRVGLPVLAKSAPGSIINISSIAGLIASYNFVAYNTAKAGVWMLTKSVALQATRQGYDVRVNSIHPAFIDTTMVDDVVAGASPEENRAKLARQVPMKKIGTPEDVGHACIYLASDESGFMTASEIKLDGGISAM